LSIDFQERISIERLILEADDRITKLIMQVNKNPFNYILDSASRNENLPKKKQE